MRTEEAGKLERGGTRRPASSQQSGRDLDEYLLLSDDSQASGGCVAARRGADGSWPDRRISVTEGLLELESIGFQVELTALYSGTRLAVH